jgi:hypothetical protein
LAGRYKEVSIDTPGAVGIDFTITESAWALIGKLREIRARPEMVNAANNLKILTALQYLESESAAP